MSASKTKGFIKTRVKDSIKPSALVFKGGSIGFEFARAMREKVRGEYRFSSLMKQKKKGAKYAVFCFAGKRNFFFIFMM